MTDYVSVIAKRNERLNKIRADERLLVAAKIHYKNNPVDFINDWLFTYDPRLPNSLLPFLLFKRQEEYISWLMQRWQNQEDGLVEKSRDMGLTWMSMAFAIWMWLFHEGVKIGFGSRKEDLVDRMGDPDCIFEKGRTILKTLPKQLLPAGFSVDSHCPHMKILNPENSSSIIGESGKEIGRGGRSTMYFKDESAFYEQPMRIDAALSQNSNVKIDISTPNGEGNPFWKKRFGGAIPVFTFHWRDDPRKDEAWYQAKVAKEDPIIIAQEVDIDYAAAVDDVCIPAKWVRAAVELKLPNDGARYAGLDVADGGADFNVLIMRKGVVVDYIEGWKEDDTTITARRAYTECLLNGVKYFAYDVIGVGSGIKGETNSLTKDKEKSIVIAPFDVRESPTSEEFTEDKSNADLFADLKAEMWWKMRRRFFRTYQHVNGIKEWQVEDMISIPNHAELISELSRPKIERIDDGKMRIESKKKMKARGIKSPDYADALIICFYNNFFSYDDWL